MARSQSLKGVTLRFNLFNLFKDHAVYSDGCGVLYVLKTGNRDDLEQCSAWKSLFHDEICGKARPFSILSSSITNEGK
jgi:hypothetical protein